MSTSTPSSLKYDFQSFLQRTSTNKDHSGTSQRSQSTVHQMLITPRHQAHHPDMITLPRDLQVQRSHLPRTTHTANTSSQTSVRMKDWHGSCKNKRMQEDKLVANTVAQLLAITVAADQVRIKPVSSSLRMGMAGKSRASPCFWICSPLHQIHSVGRRYPY